MKLRSTAKSFATEDCDTTGKWSDKCVALADTQKQEEAQDAVAKAAVKTQETHISHLNKSGGLYIYIIIVSVVVVGFLGGVFWCRHMKSKVGSFITNAEEVTFTQDDHFS
jgi:cobalamin biosynthesis Mg chelatase CobN